MGVKASRYKLRAQVRAGKYKFRARADKLGVRVGKYRLGARTSRYKLGPRTVNINWGPVPVNTNWGSGLGVGKYKDSIQISFVIQISNIIQYSNIGLSVFLSLRQLGIFLGIVSLVFSLFCTVVDN